MREYHKLYTKEIDGEKLSLGVAMVSYAKGGRQDLSLAVYNEIGVLDSIKLRRSKVKEAYDFIYDCALNLNKEEYDNTKKELDSFLEKPTIRHDYKTKLSNIEIWQKLCDYVKEYEVPNITDYDNDGKVRIEKEKFASIIKEIVGMAYHKEMVQFFLDSGYLKTGSDRVCVYVNKSDTCPRGYRAYIFEDYYKIVIEKEVA